MEPRLKLVGSPDQNKNGTSATLTSSLKTCDWSECLAVPGGCWESGLLMLSQLHAALNGAPLVWSVAQNQTALSAESQNLNNKCSRATSCSMQSTQGQRTTMEPVSLLNTRSHLDEFKQLQRINVMWMWSTGLVLSATFKQNNNKIILSIKLTEVKLYCSTLKWRRFYPGVLWNQFRLFSLNQTI